MNPTKQMFTVLRMKAYKEIKNEVYSKVIERGYRNSLSLEGIEQMAAEEFAEEYFKQRLISYGDELRELILKIPVDASNLNHIAKTGQINGSLLIAIENIFKSLIKKSEPA